jgi:meso-butanediol dehydrogenase/(S,S)-butanediol dehydrogenase/diacetyl reductase
MPATSRPDLTRRLAGRRALVTGGGSGIGRAVALRLAAEGASVAVAGRRRGPLQATAQAIDALGARSLVVRGDLSVEAEATRVVIEAGAAFDGLDVLVNCAGTIHRGQSVHELDAETFDRQIADNLRTVFLVTKAALGQMIGGEADRSIVNIASTLAHSAGSGTSAYTAAKGGVVAFTRAVAIEYAQFGVRCNCVCPATVRTPMAYADRPDFDDLARDMEALYPLKRLGEPEDVAAAVAYLASDESGWVTGTVFNVDGGLSAW